MAEELASLPVAPGENDAGLCGTLIALFHVTS
jgi:hypothetical protein